MNKLKSVMDPKGNKTVRLAHFLAQRGVASRRKSEVLVQDGAVSLNGEIVIDPATPVNPDVDSVKVHGADLPEKKSHLYLALNKPVGYLSTFVKGREKGKLLGELVKFEERLFTVGRLDRESRGLLLLTTDGDWANRVMHPRYEKEKEYHAFFKKISSKVASNRLAKAKIIERGKKFSVDKAFPRGKYVEIVIHEGRNRQIRRLASSAKLDIQDLVRVRIGKVHLGKLKEGYWRKLTVHEIKSFK